jgi:hypothetical protein
MTAKRSTEKRPVVVTLDIETAPLEVYVWRIWEENVGIDQIKKDWCILSFAYKFLDEKKVYFHCTGGRGPDKVRDDKKLVELLWEILDKADVVVLQNGKAFDIKKINARMAMYGMKPYSPIKVIDTMLIAKKQFGFTSNKLEFLARILTDTGKSKHKKFPGFELWEECLKDNPEAWIEMEKYNKIDVVADEKVYLRLRPWVEGHPNFGVYSSTEEVTCPKCGSTHLQKRGSSYTQVGEYHRFQCLDCHGWARSRYVTNTKEKRKALLSN